MRRIPIEYFGSALLESGVTFGVVFGGIVFLVPLFIHLDANLQSTLLIMVGLGIGAAAVCTAQTGLALLAPEFISSRSKTVQLLTAISTFDGLIAMFIFGIAYIYGGSFNEVMGERAVLFQGPIFGIFACACLFVLYSLMMVRRCEDSELVLIVIGMTILSSGAAAMLGFSPLITNFILGVGLVNFSREKERIFQFLMNIEKPVYLILLVFLGVGWQLHTPWVFLLAGGLCLFRFLGKWLGGGIMTRLLPPPHRHQYRIGFGLMDSGGLPLAILFDFQQWFSHSMTAYVVSIGLLMVVYNDLLSPHFFSYLFKRERI